ncbi:hypothetical protein ACJX0J_023563, partial [Zea mays]
MINFHTNNLKQFALSYKYTINPIEVKQRIKILIDHKIKQVCYNFTKSTTATAALLMENSWLQREKGF